MVQGRKSAPFGCYSEKMNTFVQDTPPNQKAYFSVIEFSKFRVGWL